MNIRDILMTYEPRPSAEVDQALKEISELLVDCKPKKRTEYVPTENQDFRDLGYNMALDDYEKNIKDLLQ